MNADIVIGTTLLVIFFILMITGWFVNFVNSKYAFLPESEDEENDDK